MCAPPVTRHTSIRYSSSCHTCVNMGAFCLHRHPVSVNCLYRTRMVLSVGGSFVYFARNARCTVTTESAAFGKGVRGNLVWTLLAKMQFITIYLHISYLNFKMKIYEILMTLGVKILAHSVYKMWIIQEPNMLELWNKLHSEEEKTESIYYV